MHRWVSRAPSGTMTPTSPGGYGMAIKRVGFIGLGIMGAPMAANLLKAGFEVTVWNRSPSRTQPLRMRAPAAPIPRRTSPPPLR